MNPPNFQAYVAQVAIVVLVCAGLPRLLKLRAPVPQYAFWRLVLAVCLLLPVVQPWQPAEMAFVAAPGPAVSGSPRPPINFAAPAGAKAARFDWVAAARFLILLGIAARLAWIALGMIRLRWMRRLATEPVLGFDDLREAIGADPPILWSAEIRHPVTFGLFAPVVLLPAALKRAELPAQRAVVAHELYHVKRHDFGWVVAEELVRSIFWFHPAVWWLVSRVQLARETVVDELSILITNARRTYLDTLLAFADDSGLASSPAFSARRHLFHRVMLLSKEEEMSSVRVALGSCVLVLALSAGSWGAVQAFPLHGQEQAPPRDPQSPQQLHALAVHYWELVQRSTDLPIEEKRLLILKGIAAEDRALALKADFVQALLYKGVLLRTQAVLADDPQAVNDLIQQSDAIRSRAMDLIAAGVNVVDGPVQTNAAVPSPSSPPPAKSAEFEGLLDQDKPLRIGGSVRTPAKVHDERPVYPPIARSAKVQGVVIAEVLIDASGLVVDARILRSIPLLDEAALAAIRTWEFAPTLLNGSPTPVLMTVTVNFTVE